jgi:MFS family permease
MADATVERGRARSDIAADRTRATSSGTVEDTRRAPEGSVQRAPIAPSRAGEATPAAQDIAVPGARGTAFGPAWYASLRGNARRAFHAAFFGFALDAFDYILLTLSLTAIAATFSLTPAKAGTLVTTTLVVSALGGIGAGVLADRIGRVRTLMLTVGVYSVFTVLCAFAQSYDQLLVLRAFQGLGFGGEWAIGAALVAEVARAEHRGRILGVIQSSWSVGWAAAVVAYTIVFAAFDEGTAWRVLFLLGALPAVLVVYLRARVKDSEVFLETRRAARERRREGGAGAVHEFPLKQIFRRDLLGTTLAASVLAIGVQGGYYAMFTWIPAFLKTERGFSVVGTSGYLSVLIIGSFIGYVSSGYVHDVLGRRKTFALFCVGSALALFAYTMVPAGEDAWLLVIGGPLGFFSSGAYSGFGSYLAELFPSRARAAGQGFTYNIGRAVGAFFPATIGVLAGFIGLTGAILFGCVGYAIAMLSLLALPETMGKTLTAVD